MYVGVPAGARKDHRLTPMCLSSIVSLRQDLSLNLKFTLLTGLSGQQAPGRFLLGPNVNAKCYLCYLFNLLSRFSLFLEVITFPVNLSDNGLISVIYV